MNGKDHLSGTGSRRFLIVFTALVLLVTVSVALSETVWSTTPPEGLYITKTQYRGRVRETAQGTSPTMDGWTLYDQVAGAWGDWISNGQTAISAETDREVRTVSHAAVTATTSYKYRRYKYVNTSDGKTYLTYGSNWATSHGYSGTWEYKEVTVSDRLSPYNVYDGVQSYGVKGNFWFYEEPVVTTQTPAWTEYQYRTRTRTYYFCRYGSWSDWQDDPLTASDALDVETRTLYAADESKLPSTIEVGEISEVSVVKGTGMQLCRLNNLPIFTWRSSDPWVASVDQSGYLSAHNEGTATVTVSMVSGSSASIQVNVYDSEGMTAPASLTEIDANAFKNTAFKVVDLRASHSASIAAGAFAGSGELKLLVAPDSLTQISDTAFTNSGVIFACTSNNAAAAYARNKNIPYYVIGQEQPYVKVTSVTLSASTLTVRMKDSASLTAQTQPSDATSPRLIWQSSNPAVATVSSSGTVTGVSVGSATVTVTAADNASATASCTVTVTPIPVSAITLSAQSLNVVKGGSATLTATVSPADASNKAVTWTSSNTSVATVSAGGVVSGIASGTAQITCTAADGSGVSATCTVNVTPDTLTGDTYFNSVAAESITQTDATIRFRPKQSDYPTAGGFYFGTSESNLRLIKSETYSAIANNIFFNITKYYGALSPNTKYYYKVYYVYGGVTYYSAVHNLTTLQNVTISPASSSVEVGENETKQLSVTTNVSGASVSWASSNTSIATVSSSGVVSGKKGGTVTVTATATYVNSTATATFTVTVNPIKYHVVIIGNYNYSLSTLENIFNFVHNIPIIGDWLSPTEYVPAPGMKNDSECLARAMRVNCQNHNQTPDVHYYLDISKSAALNHIRSDFSVADYNDINIFYFGGHGSESTHNLCMYNGDQISPSELRSAFSNVKGKTLVMICACYSGTFTNFASGLTSGSFYVMTSCQSNEETYNKYQNSAYVNFGYFLLLGMGWDDPNQSETAYLNADLQGNGDGAVTLDEMYTYLSYRVTSDADLRGGEQHTTRSWSSGQGDFVIYLKAN